MGDFLWWILIGLVAGGLGKLIMPGKDPGGCLVTILIGIAGALLVGYVGQIVGFYEPGESTGFIGATIGAIALLALYRVILKVRGRG
ncbi:GlsB/YeaQ/YmgE family stress response membrane protein [Sphingomonas sp. LaA6.9]|uniref:GlsB/YeaQ/YmgE family stress response membrane protein n=1 Tax=Sphingomonas sp. LaA6.9 TaxID=2919914 RepID=UPI001F4F1BB1|nr:GlsB/YeaQ/YmgE family stress response membrane protein [Sphingomonas sp. LaA6.9]MCJ8156253.1 GlsB/YeaQ/YmgE family stress response membrane protein [Sphingomonas sp. LaA6.9]